MAKLKGLDLLIRLIKRGEIVYINQGRLEIKPSGHKKVPLDFLLENKADLTYVIAKLLNLNIYQYVGYSTGRYGSKKCEGITLQFSNMVTGEEAHVIFNVELNRARSSKYHQAGSPLPKGQFRVSKKFLFYKFWLSTELSLPPRLASFHDYMGNLKDIFFIPETDAYKGKISAKLIPLCNVSYEQIKSALAALSPDNLQTNARQLPYNNQTGIPNKEFPQPFRNQAVERELSTGESNYGSSYQGSAVISNQLPITNKVKRPQDQTVDEWLSDWENA
ncbi:hypothetical protein FGD67_12360 [Colwellia sp. M166]|uniref:hypothetical protein n=1 Tax=Colwellia sp. M166 TaxID=2583805 RepID=UPI00211E26FC|nr:hypothetical protein [Colwellia sp. M166]UUO23927.1 hypothetical protein FGD67_12360 [Colwellia sp. M166]|tara:strand:- start:3194 stop:4021 length:828 start_codon:yes stop_codon:yes gene_type:complete